MHNTSYKSPHQLIRESQTSINALLSTMEKNMDMKSSKFAVMMGKLGDIASTWTSMLIAAILYCVIIAIIGWLAAPLLLEVIGAVGAAWRGQ